MLRRPISATCSRLKVARCEHAPIDYGHRVFHTNFKYGPIFSMNDIQLWWKNELAMNRLSKVLVFKIIFTLTASCIPLLLFPASLLQWIGFPIPNPLLFLRLLGMAYTALIVGYSFGLKASMRGHYPVGVVWMGIVSNVGAFTLLALAAIQDVWGSWGFYAQALMWVSLFSVGCISIGLIAFGPCRSSADKTRPLSLNAENKKPMEIASNNTTPVAVTAAEAPTRTKKSLYPEPFASRMSGRQKRPLGDLFGLTNFGVNITRLSPSAVSALRHAHSKQDEFIYILEGHPTLITDEGETPLSPGTCAGFKAGTGNGHQLRNLSQNDVVYLEIGDRTPDDSAIYPDDDLQALFVDGHWRFMHKDGRRYDTSL